MFIIATQETVSIKQKLLQRTEGFVDYIQSSTMAPLYIFVSPGNVSFCEQVSEVNIQIIGKKTVHILALRIGMQFVNNL